MSRMPSAYTKIPFDLRMSYLYDVYAPKRLRVTQGRIAVFEFLSYKEATAMRKYLSMFKNLPGLRGYSAAVCGNKVAVVDLNQLNSRRSTHEK